MREPNLSPLQAMPMTFFAARPSRWQLWRARMWLLFCTRRAELMSAWMSVGLFLLAALEFSLCVTLPSAVIGLNDVGRVALVLFGLVAAGGMTLLASWRVRDDLELQQCGGALIGLGPRFSWTEHGSTTVCEWELMHMDESPLGLIFELPWRLLCLLPYEVMRPALFSADKGQTPVRFPVAR